MAGHGSFPDDGRDPLLRSFLPRSEVDLHLLGGFGLRVDGRPVALVTAAQRVVALVALLGPLPRSRVAGTLWPHADDRSAMACLRTALWRCNRVAPQAIECRDDQLRLSVHVRVDALRPEQVHADLLPGWDDEWLTVERERLHQKRLHDLENLAHSLAVAGQYAAALQAALRALSLDPLRESAHRAVMAVHLAEGNRSEALRSYHRCAVVLRRELGVEPAAATARMVRAGPLPAPRRGSTLLP